ncbi:MAG: nitrate reductase molybdenum cofactor assembly chaperone [Frankiaceae bacterium]|nr:nitrate reductase molybdenum cofactor assembly chaperone [Frankiaceae bacterium]
MRRLRAPKALGITPAQQAVSLQAVSLLLGYPEPDLVAQVPLLRAVAAELPEPARLPLERMCDHLEATPVPELQAHYTDVFDLRRRCCLYLTYFSYGDTRQRGMALLRFSHVYKGSGLEFVGGELPDHLGVVCEFAATADLELGVRLLNENRAAIELIRTALVDAGSFYADVLDVVRAALPEAAPRDLEKALELARTGPPEEEVGLEPFGPPELMGARR